MKKLISILLLLPFLATASIDITNIPLGGWAMTDTLLGVTNNNYAARATVQQIVGTATNGYPWTNILPQYVLSPVLTNQIYASNVLSGGYLIMGTVATNTGWDGAVMTYSNASRVWSANGGGLTNVTADNALNAYGVSSIATNTLPIGQVTTPGAILTNGESVGTTFSNAVLVNSGTGGINSTAGGNATNALEISTAYNQKALLVSTNGNIWVSAGNKILSTGQIIIIPAVGTTLSLGGGGVQDVASVGGSSLTVAGFIRATAATDAAISLQARQHSASQSANLTEWQTVGGTAFANIGPNGDASFPSLKATNGVIQMVKPSFTTNFTCTTNLQTYLLNGTAPQIITLPNAANVPNVVYHFSTTNDSASYIITNATGTQTVSDGKSLSYTNSGSGKGVVSLMSDGAHWWLMAKGKTRLPCAQFSTSTNTTFVLITNTITLETTDFNNNLGIGLDNSAWFTAGVGSRIYCTNLGAYMITISAIWSKTSGSADNGDIWLRQSSIDIPNSMTLLTIPNTATNVMTVNFLVNVVTNNTYFDFQGASTGGAGQLQAMPAITSPFNRPACPSVIVTVNKISD